MSDSRISISSHEPKRFIAHRVRFAFRDGPSPVPRTPSLKQGKSRASQSRKRSKMKVDSDSDDSGTTGSNSPPPQKRTPNQSTRGKIQLVVQEVSHEESEPHDSTSELHSSISSPLSSPTIPSLADPLPETTSQKTETKPIRIIPKLPIISNQLVTDSRKGAVSDSQFLRSIESDSDSSDVDNLKPNRSSTPSAHEDSDDFLASSSDSYVKPTPRQTPTPTQTPSKEPRLPITPSVPVKPKEEPLSKPKPPIKKQPQKQPFTFTDASGPRLKDRSPFDILLQNSTNFREDPQFSQLYNPPPHPTSTSAIISKPYTLDTVSPALHTLLESLALSKQTFSKSEQSPLSIPSPHPASQSTPQTVVHIVSPTPSNNHPPFWERFEKANLDKHEEEPLFHTTHFLFAKSGNPSSLFCFGQSSLNKRWIETQLRLGQNQLFDGTLQNITKRVEEEQKLVDKFASDVKEFEQTIRMEERKRIQEERQNKLNAERTTWTKMRNRELKQARLLTKEHIDARMRNDMRKLPKVKLPSEDFGDSPGTSTENGRSWAGWSGGECLPLPSLLRTVNVNSLKTTVLGIASHPTVQTDDPIFNVEIHPPTPHSEKIQHSSSPSHRHPISSTSPNRHQPSLRSPHSRRSDRSSSPRLRHYPRSPSPDHSYPDERRRERGRGNQDISDRSSSPRHRHYQRTPSPDHSYPDERRRDRGRGNQDISDRSSSPRHRYYQRSPSPDHSYPDDRRRERGRGNQDISDQSHPPSPRHPSRHKDYHHQDKGRRDRRSNSDRWGDSGRDHRNRHHTHSNHSRHERRHHHSSPTGRQRSPVQSAFSPDHSNHNSPVHRQKQSSHHHQQRRHPSNHSSPQLSPPPPPAAPHTLAPQQQHSHTSNRSQHRSVSSEKEEGEL